MCQQYVPTICAHHEHPNCFHPTARVTHSHDPTTPTTRVYVGVAPMGIVGVCDLADELRQEAVHVVEALRARGCNVAVLSGDSDGAVAGMAAKAGIADALGGMSPEDKVARVQALRQQGRTVAMVGDGVNDAPALAGADVGIALSSGLEAAASAADVVLVGSNLNQLVAALDTGRASLNKIRQNLAWALVYNLGGIPLAAGVLLPAYGVALSPSVAAGLMACSSIAVVGVVRRGGRGAGCQRMSQHSCHHHHTGDQ